MQMQVKALLRHGGLVDLKWLVLELVSPRKRKPKTLPSLSKRLHCITYRFYDFNSRYC